VRSDGRHIPAELRTAMIVSGRECSIDGCHGREYLGLDHCEIDYAEKGPTARWNLAWLCSIHHKRKTIGWTLGPPDPHRQAKTRPTPERRATPSRLTAPPAACADSGRGSVDRRRDDGCGRCSPGFGGEDVRDRWEHGHRRVPADRRQPGFQVHGA
jgi:hypothetical protein